MRVRGGRPRRCPRRAGEAQAVPRAQPVDGARPRRFRAAARAAARFHALRGLAPSRVLGLLQRVAVDGGRPGLRLDGRRVEAHVDAAVGAGDDLHRRLPFWTRGRLGELLACLATPLPKEAKKGGEAALLAVVTLGWLLESVGASAGGSWCKIALVWPP